MLGIKLKNKVLVYLKNRRIITIIMQNIAVIGIGQPNIKPVCRALSGLDRYSDYVPYINTIMQMKYWPFCSLDYFDAEVSKGTSFQCAILVTLREGGYINTITESITKISLRVIILVYDQIQAKSNIDDDIKLLITLKNVYSAMKIDINQSIFDCKSHILEKIGDLISAIRIRDSITNDETKCDKQTINYGDALKPLNCIWIIEPNDAINKLYQNLYDMYYGQEFTQTLDLIKSDDNLKKIFAGIQEILSRVITNDRKLLHIKDFLLNFGLKMHS